LTATSKGERAVRRFLEGSQIGFKAEARIIPDSQCAFDFELLDRPTLIEFHGRQHYQAISFFGGVRAFRKTQRRDRFKAKWAAENGYELIVIPYWESIEEILTKRLLLTKAA
jgi:hypothetical protein